MKKFAAGLEKILNYWMLAIKHTASKSVNFLAEFQGDVLRGLISLFALLGVSYLTSSGIIQVLDFKAFWGDFETYARFLGALVLLVPINFVLRLFLYTPSELFWEQKLLADKYSWEGIHFNVYQFPKDSIFGWGLSISNQKPVALEYVSARLTYLIQTNKHSNDKSQIPINNTANLLPWDKGKGQCEWGETTLLANGVKNLVLITEDGYKMSWFFFTDNAKKKSAKPQVNSDSETINNHIKLFDLHEYLFEIEFNAKVQGHNLETYIFKGKLSKKETGRMALIEQL